MPNLLKLAALSKRLQPIIMLSHMRANTSLFGHILGNNPEINGYYEMHIGYYSWKSLIRQKLKYLEEHQFKKGSKYIFDKVLHNEHAVNCGMLIEQNAKIIISLRSPEETIPSIIKLYQEKVDPKHEFARFSGAADYYKQRLATLNDYSEQLKGKFIYIDANDIKEKTEQTFAYLQKELALKYPLTAEYNIQNMTGKGESGDHSENLKKGKIIKHKTDYSGIDLNNEKITELNSLYQEIRENILSNRTTAL